MRTWPAVDVDGLTEPELLQATLSDFRVAAIDERAPDSWRIFFDSAAERDRAMAALSKGFPSMLLQPADIADEDWAARSQASLRAIRVGDIIVAPPWDVPPAGHPATAMASGRPRSPLVVVIEPSTGFGTGHHPTTRLCLAALQQFDLQGSTVVDVGTGSGVLAIAARLLGASRVLGVDEDPDAVQAARENVRLNGAAVDLVVADFRHLVLARFDLVLANLTGALLTAGAGRLQDLTARRGPLIASGFTTEEEPSVIAAFPRLRLVDRTQEDEWVCLTLQHGGAFE
jgi:ribosomal protein L11 methyltransferase